MDLGAGSSGRQWARAAVLVPLLVLTLLTAGARPADSRNAEPVVAYRPPVVGALVVVRGFDDVGRYEAGHRGVDLRVAPPALALAAGPGTVTFAGQVAGRGVVTVLHADGVRTSYEPVVPGVAVGAVVAAGDPLGAVSGVHGGFPADTVLHWGARVGERYVDPLGLLVALGPVRLLPWDP